MPTPDFFQSRRQLRRSRLQDALGLPREGVNIELHRNRLIEPLVIAADSPITDFGSLPQTTVDTVVSLALTELDETPIEALLVVLLCIRILAANGEFARLSLLAGRLQSLCRLITIDRPYLSAATAAFGLALQSREQSAVQILLQRLGISGTPEPAIASSREQINDILMATTLQRLLVTDDRAFAEKARYAAITTQDGFLLAYIEAITTWHEAADRARPIKVLVAADPTFADPALVDYLTRRRIRVLFPPQIKAIRGGATHDQNRVVSLPTSSGKTLLAEFRIAAALTRNPGTRAIYVAPYRMLARQVEHSFRTGLGPLKITVKDLGSGFDPSFDQTADVLPDVSICTPERLDALLRVASTETPNGLSASQLFGSTNVVIFDELQLVGRPGRGPRFELILTRLREQYPDILILGLSAASQGSDELSQWLTGTDAISGASRPTGTLEIVWETDGTLLQRVEPRPTTVAQLPRSRQAADDAASLVLRLHPRYRPILVVDINRHAAESLAQRLVQLGSSTAAEWRDLLEPSQLGQINAAVEELRMIFGSSHPLPRYVSSGIAFHHAGMPTEALRLIERLAQERLLRVVCATTTVAEGADLPFRVVVLPHLNFPGPSRRLERDLYLNIIGRAGRANVAVEGISFILNSAAPTLKNVVRGSLWSNTTADRIRGRIGEIPISPRTVDDWAAYSEVQSQVLGWLGDSNSYVDDQARVFAARTLTWRQGTRFDRQAVTNLFATTLTDLERHGYALAASPYRLTTRGKNARLTGLSALTVARLERAIERGRGGWLRDLSGIKTLSIELATQIAQILFESVEVTEKSLWMRHVGTSEQAKFEALSRFARGDERSFVASDEYEADISLLSAWLMGTSYLDLSRVAPTYERANSLFGGRDEAKRTSDATEYIGKLTYPASWVWSGVRVLAGDLGDTWPGFVRNAIELGLPSEGGVELVAQTSLTRSGAMLITRLTGPRWEAVLDWIITTPGDEFTTLGITSLDADRLVAFKERLLLS